MSCGCGGFGVHYLLGWVPGEEPLPLTAGDDYVRSIELKYPTGHPLVGQPQPFPSGGTLALHIDTKPVKTVWQYTISGSVASIKIESEEVDKIPDRTSFKLKFLPPGELGGGTTWITGKVKLTK